MERDIESKPKKKRFSFGNFARIIIKRQKEKEADTFIIIYGQPRTGKTNLGFNILIPFLIFKRRLFRLGKDSWEVPKTWKRLLKEFFSTGAEDMTQKIKGNPDGSFEFVDEGIDVVSWHHQMEKEQQDLVDLLQKSGKKKILTILITPNMGLLTKAILARARYLFIIIDEPSKGTNYALLFKNYDNPILAENYPFGLKDMIKDLLKKPKLGEKRVFENYVLGKDRFVGKVSFKKIDQKLYNLYEKIVKDPSIMATRKKGMRISYSRFIKLQYAFDTLIYNLAKRDGKSISQIKTLLIDKFGFQLVSPELIRDHLSKTSVLEKRPHIDDSKEVLNGEEKEIIDTSQDIELEEEIGTT